MKNIPNKIFLNIGYEPEKGEDFNDLGEVTWCADKVNDSDIEYQRKPIWHDLNKNPKDFPKDWDVVIVSVKQKFIAFSDTGYYDGKRWWVDEEVETPNVIAWINIPKFK